VPCGDNLRGAEHVCDQLAYGRS